MEKGFKVNLQLFAEGEDVNDGSSEVDNEYFQESYEDLEEVQETETSETAEGENEDSKQDGEKAENTEAENKTFTQADIDSIVQKRIERERKNFEKEQESNARKVRDSYIAEQGYQHPLTGNKITNEAEYQQALKDQDRYEELIKNNGFSEEQARQLAQNDSKTDMLQKELDSLKEEKEQKNAIIDVMNWHDKMVEKGVLKGDFDYTTIPKEILTSGNSLKESYMEYVMGNLKVDAQQETLKNLEDKSKRSASSTQDNSQSEVEELSFEVINKMSNDSAWVAKNYEKIEKSGYFKQF